MKIAVIVVRIIMGLLFLVSVIGFFFKLMPQPKLGEGAMLFVTGMMATGYLMPVVKGIELLCAIAFLTGRFVPLATVVIFPITINIVLFHSVLAPDSLIVPAVLLLGNLFLAYVYRKNYEMVLSPR
jgi:putative oxidoreductase